MGILLALVLSAANPCIDGKCAVPNVAACESEACGSTSVRLGRKMTRRIRNRCKTIRSRVRSVLRNR